MKENIEQLETNKAALELLLNEHNEKLNDYRQQISQLEKKIEDYNKPPITPEYEDKIYEAVEKAVEYFDFDNDDNYSLEFGIDYDGRVHCESFSFDNGHDLVQSIVDKVLNLFREADCPTDEEDKS